MAYGVSDWPKFAKYFSPKISYTNTQYDRVLFSEHPTLDITSPREDWAETADLIICSEVLEHVIPPVQRAFDGLAALLKSGGTLVFSVPHTFDETIEHFPDLHDWSLETNGDGERVLINTTLDGRREQFEKLCFHGGGEVVLEMRIFGLSSLLRHLRDAGFENVELMDYDVLESGIHFRYPWSRPMIARKVR